MPMTKRDIADIVLVWILSSVLLSLLISIAQVSFIGMARGPKEVANQAIFFGFEALQVLVLLLLGYILLFKRPAVLSFLFPDGREKEIAVPGGLEVLTSYAFWIRLFGVFKFLWLGVQLIGHLATSMAMEWPFLELRSFRSSGPELVGVILSAAIIWKADWIADKLQTMRIADKTYT
jgi:hypothetical protein